MHISLVDLHVTLDGDTTFLLLFLNDKFIFGFVLSFFHSPLFSRFYKMSVLISRCDFIAQLPEEEKEAFENIFPCNKYPSDERIMISFEQWSTIKLDYDQKMKDYYGFIKALPADKSYENDPYIQYSDIVQNCPRILRPLQIEDEKEPAPGALYQIAIQNKPDIKIIEIESLGQLEQLLMNSYQYEDCSTTNEINIEMLTKDLMSGKIFYKINSSVYSQICDFKYMNKLLLKPQQELGHIPSVPYNKCLAIFMVLYYMRCDYLCTEFVKNMEMIMGNFHGLLDMRELMLKLHFPISVAQEDLVSQEMLHTLADGFPTLVDMKLSFYKFGVMETGHKITLCFSKSKSFYMNKITYSTFAEHFENMTVNKLRRYQQFRLSMLYTFKLIIPDQENFELAKSVGFIDSNRIDWQFWKDNVIKCPYFIHHSSQDFLVKRQYDTLTSMKKRYYNFFSNLYTDYHRTFVHEPVSLVFNIAAVIFAMTGVISVLQNAGIIPSLYK